MTREFGAPESLRAGRRPAMDEDEDNGVQPYWCPWCRSYERTIVCHVCGRECDLTSGPNEDEGEMSDALPGQSITVPSEGASMDRPLDSAVVVATDYYARNPTREAREAMKAAIRALEEARSAAVAEADQLRAVMENARNALTADDGSNIPGANVACMFIDGALKGEREG